MLDQDDEWAMKIYRVREMVDQKLKSSTGSENSSTRPMSGRKFVDQDGGILDQEDKWSRRIYRVRGFVDQELKSSTGSKNSSTRTRNGRGFVNQELKSSTGTDNSSSRTADSSTRTMNVEENLSGPRIRRPEVGIVNQVREFVNQDEEWSRIRRPGRRNPRPGR
ncbi:unnamed protein product [Arabidopsis thaliana]|uniref:Uncharacterized protein n=1 Tax=Arabidopsis thaliana TaxID=3702 RepID=A0A654FKG3_ARATH|nr:unnamed protein product [Arabidopsis thaliana]